ncbi:O-methyltransferase family 2 [Methanocaldococcus vulcanius M7]|uniref:O-methyltransferase family 2 n=1 Tax=Methanocaldococcus vulcanius (strain ATCC 700851 / DSM 12094 / M7) TaxID=579137 RepID=C9RGY2_METVM|nr:methyltransferase dimerization domain-containing protein [Methanocaldococcus vulcanius]ACX72834.1 O-methyltransferase family 2 [Methanocaldococcus vulcanius M7]
MLLNLPDKSPEKILEIFNEVYTKTKLFYLLKTAIELGLFDHLEEFRSVEELAEILKIDVVMTEYILKVLEEIGLIECKTKNGKRQYKNTEISNIFLKEGSFYSLRDPIHSCFENIKNWENLSDILKNKKYRKKEDINSFFPKVIKKLADECKCWELQKILEYIAKYEEFKNAKKLLDLGGGHGLYAIGFTLLNKNLKSYVFDLPDVVKETQKFIKKYNAKNVFTIAGNFYTDDIGNGYDIIFCSYNPGGKNPKIAQKVYNALNKGGLFINKQFFPEKESIEDFLDNIEWNMFDAEGLKKDKRKYTFKGDLNLEKYLDYLKKLGFKIIEVKDINQILGIKYGKAKIIIAKKI